jgi:hypothetical protein
MGRSPHERHNIEYLCSPLGGFAIQIAPVSEITRRRDAFIAVSSRRI